LDCPNLNSFHPRKENKMLVKSNPCPNCGNTGNNVEITQNGDCIHNVCVHFNGVVRWVECSDCGFKGPNAIEWIDAWELWNKVVL